MNSSFWVSCLLTVVEGDQPGEPEGVDGVGSSGHGVEGPRGRWTGGSELR